MNVMKGGSKKLPKKSIKYKENKSIKSTKISKMFLKGQYRKIFDTFFIWSKYSQNSHVHLVVDYADSVSAKHYCTSQEVIVRLKMNI